MEFCCIFPFHFNLIACKSTLFSINQTLHNVIISLISVIYSNKMKYFCRNMTKSEKIDYFVTRFLSPFELFFATATDNFPYLSSCFLTTGKVEAYLWKECSKNGKNNSFLKTTYHKNFPRDQVLCNKTNILCFEYRRCFVDIFAPSQ